MGEERPPQSTEVDVGSGGTVQVRASARVPAEKSIAQRLRDIFEVYGLIAGFLVMVAGGVSAYFIFRYDLDMAGKDIVEIKQRVSVQDDRLVDIKISNVSISKDVDSIKEDVRDVKGNLNFLRDDVSKLKAEQAVTNDRVQRRNGYR
jgi:hypothetical protein